MKKMNIFVSLQSKTGLDQPWYQHKNTISKISSNHYQQNVENIDIFLSILHTPNVWY